MPAYVALANWTQKGIETIAEGPQRLEESKRLFQQHGIKITSFYILLGEPNVVMSFEAADDEAALQLGMAIARGGTIRGNVFRAFGENDYKQVVNKLK